MNFRDMFKSKAEKAEANAKAKQMLKDKQEARKAESIVMDRMLTNLDLGDLGPYYNRSSVAHNKSGGIKPQYSNPWSMPKENFERMVNTGEFKDSSIPSQLMSDYNLMRPDTSKNMDQIIEAFELDKIRSSIKEENIDYVPEEGY